MLHACALLRALIGLLRSGAYDRRVDNVRPLALSHIIWLGAIPLVSFLWRYSKFPTRNLVISFSPRSNFI